jgi:hypothetical protein
VTWFHAPDGYQVFFNRDESRARAPALPPRRVVIDGTAYVAPIDGAAGGTWIAANEHGLTACLLNGRANDGDADRTWRSRGALVPLVAGERSTATAVAAVGRIDLHAFRPFALALLDRRDRPAVVRWDGLALTHDEPPAPPLTSSSFARPDVRAARTRTLAAMRDELGVGGDPLALHLAYHASHRPERGRSSVCMHRPDAATLSWTWIDVAAERVTMRYSGRAPCRGIVTDPAVTLAARSRRG